MEANTRSATWNHDFAKRIFSKKYSLPYLKNTKVHFGGKTGKFRLFGGKTEKVRFGGKNQHYQFWRET
jgi:hypothetical protein